MMIDTSSTGPTAAVAGRRRDGGLAQPVRFQPELAILDGTNAACSQHGWDHGDPSAIGFYRAMFVTPLVKAARPCCRSATRPRLEIGRTRSTASALPPGLTRWTASASGWWRRKIDPMVIGGKGDSALYVVKDRYSQVKRWGNLDTTRDQPWYYMGAFIVDDTVSPPDVRLNIPPKRRLGAAEQGIDLGGSH